MNKRFDFTLLSRHITIRFNSQLMSYKSKKTSYHTSDTYEATYYLMCGATIKEVKINSRGTWHIYLDNVTHDSIAIWLQGRAMADVIGFRNKRLELKRYIKNNLPQRLV